MIIGIGSDLCAIPRISEVLLEHQERFVMRCFSEAERHHVESASKGNHDARSAGYAKRWAAKEACAKALGLGVRNSIYLKDISVENDAMGKPSLKLSGGALERLSVLAGGRAPRIDVSLTDEPPMALAFVVISAL